MSMDSILLTMIYILNVHELHNAMALYTQIWYYFPWAPSMWLTAVQYILAINAMGPNEGFFSLRDSRVPKLPAREMRDKAVSFLCKLHSHPLLHCKLPVFQLMQIHSLRNDIFLRDASLVLLRSSPSLRLYPHGNPSAQIKPKHLQLHSSYS